MEQTYKDIEIIFVDDCGKDGSMDIVRNTVEEYPQLAKRVKYVIHHANMGSSASRRDGMLAATGDYIIQVDSDDYVMPNYIENLANEAINSDSDVVMCKLLSDKNGVLASMKYQYSESPHQSLIYTLKGVLHSSLCNKLIKVSVLKENNIYPITGVNMYDDFSIVYRVLFFSKKISILDDALYIYNRNNENSYTSCRSKDYIPGFLSLKSNIDSFSEHNKWDKELLDAKHFFYVELSGAILRSLELSEIKKNRELYSFGINKIKYIALHPHIGFYNKIILVLIKLRMYFVAKSLLRKRR